MLCLQEMMMVGLGNIAIYWPWLAKIEMVTQVFEVSTLKTRSICVNSIFC